MAEQMSVPLKNASLSGGSNNKIKQNKPECASRTDNAEVING